jgi:phosphoribosyl-ATP pyrophosphohydrolase/phosphoribosyl-AMP cyclohydrolase
MSELNFEKMNGLIPVVVQDHQTKVVLMLGFMNRSAYEKTQETRQVTFFSRKNQRLYTKGEKSGNFLQVVSIHESCGHDALLIHAKAQAAVCHKGYDTCFNERNVSENITNRIEDMIRDRKTHPRAESYTSKLFSKGLNKIAQKTGEEAVELILAAKDNDPETFIGEAADLLFHYLVLLQARGLSLRDVEEKLKHRHLGE